MKTPVGKLRILFLEDIPSDVEIAVRELRKGGMEFDYESSDDRTGFIHKLIDFQPDIVISDFMLPTINGLEAIGISLDNAPDVPVIILTGSMDEQTAVACMKAGATDYVVKDFMAKLPFAVKEALEKKSARSDLERKTADLLEEKEKYRRLFENNPLPMWVYDPQTLGFVAVNNAAVVKYGYSREEFLKMTLKDIRPEEDIPLLIENIRKSSSEYERSGHWRHQLRNGELISVEIASHGIEFEGKPCRMVMANDITQRVNDEKEIRKLNRTYSVLSNVNKSIVRIHEADSLLGEICRVVIEFGKFSFIWIGSLSEEDDTINILASHGLFAEKMLSGGHPLKSVLHSNAPCAKAVISSKPLIINNVNCLEKHCFILENASDNGIKAVACFPFTMPSGSKALICFYSPEENFFDETEIELIEELTEDISFALEAIENQKARKEAIDSLTKSEARYRKFFEEDLTADYISTLDGDVVDCNKAYVSMFGFRDRDHALSTRTTQLYADPGDRQKFLDIIRKNGAIEGYEISYQTVDGRRIHAILNSFGHFDADGNLLRIQGYVFDITDIRKAQDEMREARELAEKSNRLKDAFIANISHEIRTPMNAIIGFSGIIRETLAESIDNETAGYFSVINEAGARLMRTVDMILSLSKIQAGIMESKPAEINIDQTIASIITEHQPASAKKELPVSYINRSGVDIIETDRYSFGEIVSNLVDNAIKYTHKGKVEIVAERDRGGELLIKVSDTGIGIAKEFRDRIFHPFVQEESGYSRSYEGVGLGLSIVKKFAEMAGFEIRLESEKGVGSTFTVVIPAALIKAATVAEFHTAVQEPATEAMERVEPEGKFPMVLAVEDDEDSKIYLEAILARRFRLVTVSSADEVMPAMEQFLPDVVLMDISLRGSRNGLEIAEEIRGDERFRSIPVIAVTAHAFPSDRLNAFRSGCTDYITKPFSPGTLFKSIDKALGAIK